MGPEMPQIFAQFFKNGESGIVSFVIEKRNNPFGLISTSQQCRAQGSTEQIQYAIHVCD
jgi:hypothetical protein